MPNLPKKSNKVVTFYVPQSMEDDKYTIDEYPKTLSLEDRGEWPSLSNRERIFMSIVTVFSFLAFFFLVFTHFMFDSEGERKKRVFDI